MNILRLVRMFLMTKMSQIINDDVFDKAQSKSE